MIDVIHWCSFCNKRPADGELTIEDATGEQTALPCCRPCVIDIQSKQEEPIENF